MRNELNWSLPGRRFYIDSVKVNNHKTYGAEVIGIRTWYFTLKAEDLKANLIFFSMRFIRSHATGHLLDEDLWSKCRFVLKNKRIITDRYLNDWDLILIRCLDTISVMAESAASNKFGKSCENILDVISHEALNKAISVLKISTRIKTKKGSH